MKVAIVCMGGFGCRISNLLVNLIAETGMPKDIVLKTIVTSDADYNCISDPKASGVIKIGSNGSGGNMAATEKLYSHAFDRYKAEVAKADLVIMVYHGSGGSGSWLGSMFNRKLKELNTPAVSFFGVNKTTYNDVKNAINSLLTSKSGNILPIMHDQQTEDEANKVLVSRMRLLLLALNQSNLMSVDTADIIVGLFGFADKANIEQPLRQFSVTDSAELVTPIKAISAVAVLNSRNVKVPVEALMLKVGTWADDNKGINNTVFSVNAASDLRNALIDLGKAANDKVNAYRAEAQEALVNTSLEDLANM